MVDNMKIQDKELVAVNYKFDYPLPSIDFGDLRIFMSHNTYKIYEKAMWNLRFRIKGTKMINRLWKIK